MNNSEQVEKVLDYLGDPQTVNNETICRAKKGEQWFHVYTDTQKPLYEPRYSSVGEFVEAEEGLWLARATVTSNGDTKWFHITLEGKPAYKERYNFVDDFYDGLARVQLGKNKWSHIFPDGALAYGNEFFNAAHNFKNGQAIVLDGERWIPVFVRSDSTETNVPGTSHLSSFFKTAI